ncbi:MAG: hypothetical protein U0414_38070 [Polyangiaceae bacterium]
MSAFRSTLGIVLLATAAIGLAAACDDGGHDGSTTSTASMGCANLDESCVGSADCCAPRYACVSQACCVTAGQVASTDAECCTDQRDQGACCIGLGAGQAQACVEDRECCGGAACDAASSQCCAPAGTPSPTGATCCTGKANADGKCCSTTRGACAAPGCPDAETRCETSADCCDGVSEHKTCCRFGNSDCTTDLECCSQTCMMGKCT